MSYLIDTNVMSELRKRQANANLVAWMQARPRESLYLSVLSLGEIRKGIEGVADAAFRQTLTDWLEVDLPKYFLGRLLGVDAQIADRWGSFAGQRRPHAAGGGCHAGRHRLAARPDLGHTQCQRLRRPRRPVGQPVAGLKLNRPCATPFR